MKAIAIALGIVALALAVAGFYVNRKAIDAGVRADRLQLVVDIWQNCPMPPKGYALVIESDWDGKQADQDFRCFHAKKRGANLRPSSVQEYDGRCRRGLCV